MEASEKVLIPNEPLMEIPSKWNITTPVPPISEIVPQESYPDYELPDDEYTEKLRNVTVLRSFFERRLLISLRKHRRAF